MYYTESEIREAVVEEYKSLGFGSATRGRIFLVDLTTQLVMSANNEYELLDSNRFKIKDILKSIQGTKSLPERLVFRYMRTTCESVFSRPKPERIPQYLEYFDYWYIGVENYDMLKSYKLGPKKVALRVAYHVYRRLYNK